MDFTYDDEQRALRDAVREMATRLTPSSGSGSTPTGPQPFDRAGWTKLAEMGLLGLPFAEESGGFGATPVEVVIAAGELGAARVVAPYADALAAAAMLDTAGHGLLGDVIEGSAVVLTALGEPGRGWAPQRPTRKAQQSGDSWTISGAGHGNTDLSDADAVVTTAVVDGEVGVFLVRSAKADGFAVDFASVTAERLGGGDVLAAGLDLGLVALAGEAVGAMDAALSLTTDYLKTRKQFGVPLATFQTLTQRAADMYVSVELARSCALFAAMAIGDQPRDPSTTARLKVLLGRTGRHVGQEAIQLHGGIGMTAEYAVGHYTARLTAIERTFGDGRHHLQELSARLRDHEQVEVLA
ncbi:acyl-CoA dehydrogenase family protein [Calidifontibacter terrae]